MDGCVRTPERPTYDQRTFGQRQREERERRRGREHKLRRKMSERSTGLDATYEQQTDESKDCGCQSRAQREADDFAHDGGSRTVPPALLAERPERCIRDRQARQDLSADGHEDDPSVIVFGRQHEVVMRNVIDIG